MSIGFNINLEQAMELLSLKPGFTEKELKDNYRKLMLNIHPDTLGNINPIARKIIEDEAKRVNIAKGIIESFLKEKYSNKNTNQNNSYYKTNNEEQQRKERERQEQQRKERERQEQQKREKEHQEQERREKERQELQKREKERQEQQIREKERHEQERREKEHQEQQRREREHQEQQRKRKKIFVNTVVVIAVVILIIVGFKFGQSKNKAVEVQRSDMATSRTSHDEQPASTSAANVVPQDGQQTSTSVAKEAPQDEQQASTSTANEAPQNKQQASTAVANEMPQNKQQASTAVANETPQNKQQEPLTLEQKIEIYRQSQIDRVKKLIKINSINIVEEPNPEVNGVDLNVNWTNVSNKTIETINFYFDGWFDNGVPDSWNSNPPTYSREGRCMVRSGTFLPNVTYTEVSKSFWNNLIIKTAKLTHAVIYYPDGTSDSIGPDFIQAIQ